MGAGKGPAPRPVKYEAYEKGYERINWSKTKNKETDNVPNSRPRQNASSCSD